LRAVLARYAGAAELPHNMPPHRLRHFLFTWLKTQGIAHPALQQPRHPAEPRRQQPGQPGRVAHL